MISFACPQLFGNVSASGLIILTIVLVIVIYLFSYFSLAFRKLYTMPIMRGREDDATSDMKALASERSKKVFIQVCH